MAEKIYRLTAPAAAEGMRLDQFLAGEVGEMSRGVARKIIDLGGTHVDGRRVGRCSFTVKSGQRIEVYLDGRSLAIGEIRARDILFQDPYLLVINKPAGMDFQPTPARHKGTVYEAVLRYLGSSGPGGLASVDIGMVQRLDRDTSGVAIFSIHPRAHRGLTALFSDRRVRKHYLGLVDGQLPVKEGRISSLLARQHRTNKMKSVERGGKEAVTDYRVAEEFRRATLVEVQILTGRSHQIRVHFSESGHPLLGDTRYGGPDRLGDFLIPRQMLHAWSLELDHPVTGETLSFTAPLPGDMQGVIDFLRKDDPC
jgi:23S rRNA pseudouridine1911/1915/1917 synthase